MTLATGDVAHLLMALAALMTAAHAVGTAFVRIRQPRVIGELAGGLVLGPSLLGWLWPAGQTWLFPAHGATPTVLAAVNELGLLLLLFITGTEIQRVFTRGHATTVGAVFTAGTLLPFAFGLAAVRLIDQHAQWGAHANSTSFVLVFGIAMAVTSIPVISRIMHDLGILDTDFARVILSVAVLEDLVLYVVLATAIGYAGAPGIAASGLPGVLGVSGGSAADLAYHVAASLAFLAASMLAGPPAYRWLGGLRLNLIQHSSPIAHQLTWMFAATLAALGLGLEPFFGALVAGVVVGAAEPEQSSETRAVAGFSLAFFIPIYFAMIGLRLDLTHGFSMLFFAGFAAAACAVKWGSVFAGARLAGQPAATSVHLAVAMNARGGPGIVVASTAYAAGIIDQGFYGVLVLLAILTSLAAGAWLERVPRERLQIAHGARAPAEGEQYQGA
jgi:Kef-type K+ transport system membrane component KefB